jgi:NADH:ubiquinone oxidoreductase subunit K
MTTWVQDFYPTSTDMMNIYTYRPAAAIPLFLLLAGFFGLVYHRKNIIRFLVSLELLILAVNLLFITAAVYAGEPGLLLLVPLVLALAACEAAVGLGLLVLAYSRKGGVSFQRHQTLRGLCAIYSSPNLFTVRFQPCQ